MITALRLAKAGYGTPVELLTMPSDVVLYAVAYERFLQEYEATFLALNRER